MCKVQFDMQLTGSQVSFTSDIQKIFFVLVNVTEILSERFIEKLVFGRFTFIKTNEICRDQPGVKHMHSATSLLAVLNLIMHLSRKLFYDET